MPRWEFTESSCSELWCTTSRTYSGESYKDYLSKQKASKTRFIAPKALALVVDDNPMNIVVFKSLLKRTKLQIDTAESGDECLSLAQKRKYDIIFLDHMMPEKDGIETLGELRDREEDPNLSTPAICLTANAISGAREQYIEAGFDDYLTKPVDSGKLEEILLTYLPEEKIEEAGDEEDDAQAQKEQEIPEVLLQLNESDRIDIHIGIKNNGDVESYLSLLKILRALMITTGS